MPDPTQPILPDTLLARLRELYAQPQRHYHSLEHVHALLRWLERYRALARQPALIEAAIWFHDAVYDTRRDDNETQSAALARAELCSIGWPQDAVERVAMLVLATRHHQADPSDTDAWLFLDLDLSVLGQNADRYAAYAAAVRREYGWVDEATYRQGRARVLRGFLEREHIHRTPELHRAWDAAARHNLRQELDRLLAAG